MTEDSIDRELVAAARYGDVEELEQLMKTHSLSPTRVAQARGMGGNTPLHMAAANGHMAVLELLLGVGASNGNNSAGAQIVEAANEEGSTALHWAALNGHGDAVRLLLANGARPTTKNRAGKSPMSLASQQNHMHVIELLIAAVDPDEEQDAIDMTTGADDATAEDDVVEDEDIEGVQMPSNLSAAASSSTDA